MTKILERVAAWLAFGQWSMARRIGGSFLLNALMTAAIVATAAWSLHRVGAAAQAQWLFGLGMLALLVNVLLVQCCILFGT